MTLFGLYATFLSPGNVEGNAMSNFKVVQMGESNWAVYLVNPNDPKDRYMLTSSLNSKSEAENFRREFERIDSEQDKHSILIEDASVERAIELEDNSVTDLESRRNNEPDL